MYYNYKYRLEPSNPVEDRLIWTADTCRQLYNHFVHRLNRVDNTSSYSEQKRLPDLKQWWTDLQQIHSKVLQKVVQRVYDNWSMLESKKRKGHNVGELNWKGPREYRSFKYSQSGFELKNTSDRTRLSLSKIGEIPIVYHRKIPDRARIKEVVIKQELTGEWFAVLGIETDSTQPKPETIEKCVGIDVGIRKYTHDTDGTAVKTLDFSDERERLNREKHKLSRKEHGSANYRKQQRTIARRYADIKRKRRDFLHKLSAHYAQKYDLVSVESLDVRGLIESSTYSHSCASASWGMFLQMLEYKCEREGTHFVAVNPAGTTTECSGCGAEKDKPLSVRKHSCLSWGLEVDRDLNAAYNILFRGLDKIGVVHSESMPAETVFPEGTESVPPKHVIETGSPEAYHT